MVQLGDIIEIESSPEPVKSQDKGKGKARPPSVIELSDSESEDQQKRKKNKNSSTSVDNNIPTKTPPQPQLNVSAASCANDTSKAGPSTLKHTPHPPPPLFLPGDESEEHEPLASIGHALMDDNPIQEPLPQHTDLQPPLDPIPDLDSMPMEDIDPTSTAVAQILEIMPNVEPTHLLKLIETHLPTFSVLHERDIGDGAAAREATVDEQVQGVVGHVLHLLCEDPDYPKADPRGKGKGKRVVEDEDGKEIKAKAVKKPKIDYATTSRLFPGGPNYFDLALVRPHNLLHYISDSSLSLSIIFNYLFQKFLNPTSVVNSKYTKIFTPLHISPSRPLRKHMRRRRNKDRIFPNLVVLL